MSALLLAAGLALAGIDAAPPPCPGMVPTAAPGGAKSRPVSLDDLLALRDIGQPDPSVGGPSPLAVSPDGRRIAFVISRADPAANQVCQALVVLGLEPRARPRIVDEGGEAIRAENVVRGSRTGSGLPATIVPAWSPDGRYLAYLKRVGGRTQAWRVSVDDGTAARITDAPVDVEAVAWSEDGTRLVLATRPGRTTFADAARAEGRTGFLFDHRVIPPNGFAPQLPSNLERMVWSVPREGGPVARADRQDIARLGGEPVLSEPSPLNAVTSDGRRAGAEVDGPSPFAGRRIWADGSGGRRLACTASECHGSIRGMWWDPDGRSLLFLRYEGPNNERTSLFRWTPGDAGVRRLLATKDALVGCTMAPRELLCLREASLAPRRIVGIDLASGAARTVLDPNPEFASLAKPHVERLRWTNPAGLPAWGDLVLPAGRPPAKGWPLVIVQYTSRGFLRGGTGDEYPILPLAANGIAVLSFQRPPLVVQAQPNLSSTEAVAAVLRNWDERRSTHASLEAGLAKLAARGDIDRDRMGITGLSDGSTTARYALVAGVPFRAASLSTCCRYLRSDLIYGGTVLADEMRAMGFPKVTADDPAFWAPISLPRAAHRLRTPILFQLADEEGLFALETFAALRETDVPVELRIFPDEHHIKWQPAHRAAAYARNLDWFRFWLQGDEDPDPAKREQYRRWRDWRDHSALPRPLASTP